MGKLQASGSEEICGADVRWLSRDTAASEAALSDHSDAVIISVGGARQTFPCCARQEARRDGSGGQVRRDSWGWTLDGTESRGRSELPHAAIFRNRRCPMRRSSQWPVHGSATIDGFPRM